MDSICFIVAGYTSTEKLRRLAGEILLFPTLCFTVTQLHSNSFIHNSATGDIRCVLNYLLNCDLLDCISRGIKTARRSTPVYVKRLPWCDPEGSINDDHKMIFQEKLSEFNCNERVLKVEDYLQNSRAIQLDAIGTVTADLREFLMQVEYANIDQSPLSNLKCQGE